MHYTPYIKKYLNINLKTIWQDIKEKKDPEEFLPNGSQIYYGYQGEGKTVSMMYHMLKLKNKYPKVLIVSNLNLNNLKPLHCKNQTDLILFMEKMDTTKHYIKFNTYTELELLLKSARNGTHGVIFMIDEIHNYFHSHDSKKMPIWVTQVFSQQRKQYLLILGTVQDWEDLIKVIRRQIDNLIVCKKIMKYFIFHNVTDPRDFELQYGERVAPIKKRGLFFMAKKVINSYDTYQIINSGREVFAQDSNDMDNLKINDNPRKLFKRKTTKIH